MVCDHQVVVRHVVELKQQQYRDHVMMREQGNLIDFGLKGPEAEVEKAAKWLEGYFKDSGIEHLFRGAN